MNKVLTEIIVIIALICLNGVFALAEMAMVSAKKNRIKSLADRGNRSAQSALRLKEDPEAFLSTVQVGITLIGVLAGAFAGATIAEQLQKSLELIPGMKAQAAGVSVGLVVAVVTYLSLIIGELVPKQIALGSPERMALLVARPMETLSKFSKPVVWLLGQSSALLLGFLRIKSVDEGKLTEEDIKLVLQEGSESGILEPIESTILTRGSALDTVSVRRLMTHRPDIAWLDVEKGPEENFAVLRQKEHSMYPVCKRGPDKVLGFVHARELLVYGYGPANPDLESLCKPLPFVPESLSALRLLERFKEDHVGMALVLDEYGTVEGLVTLNDVLEALVGDVASVNDPRDWFLNRGDGTFLVDGLISFEELAERLVVTNPAWFELGLSTVGGVFLQTQRRQPKLGDKVELPGLRLEVIDMDGSRVDKVLVTPIGEPETYGT